MWSPLADPRFLHLPSPSLALSASACPPIHTTRVRTQVARLENELGTPPPCGAAS